MTDDGPTNPPPRLRPAAAAVAATSAQPENQQNKGTAEVKLKTLNMPLV